MVDLCFVCVVFPVPLGMVRQFFVLVDLIVFGIWKNYLLGPISVLAFWKISLDPFLC